jgi:hypothetical protein
VLVLLVAAAVAGATLIGRSRAGAPPVNAHLPWHAAVVDSRGGLEPWYRPGAGRGFDGVLRAGWTFLERRVPVDRRAGVRVYLAYAVYDERTLQGTYWQHDPASLYASLVDAVVPWYAYAGDRRAVGVVGRMLDYQLRHGTTPRTWSWGGVPFATSCGGAREYGGCFVGLPRLRRTGIEPDKVALLGVGYARFFELTGRRRYLAAALHCADALVRHLRAGDATHTPWPFRVDARTGRTVAGAAYGGAQVAAVRLFDELLRLHAGDASAYRRARAVVWRWLLRHPLDPRSSAWNRWSGFYEDMPYDPSDVDQVLPVMTADYLLESRRPATLDRAWRRDVAGLLRWVARTFGRGPFHGARAIDEQLWTGRRSCCSPAGLGSDTARWAAAEALYAARTGSVAARRAATRSLAYATYFARGDGRVSCCGVGAFRPAYWFSDGYGDYLGNISRALGALPQLAPPGEDHLVHSTSVVTSVAYGRRRLAYRTFDRQATEVLRLSFRPGGVVVDGRRLARRSALDRDAYTVSPLATDYVVRIRHDGRTVDVRG